MSTPEEDLLLVRNPLIAAVEADLPWGEVKVLMAALIKEQKTLTMGDLKKMYREFFDARKRSLATGSDNHHGVLDTLFLVDDEGDLNIVIENRGNFRNQKIANGYIKITEEQIIEDPAETIRRFKGVIVTRGDQISFDCDDKQFSSNAAFAEVLTRTAGCNYLYKETNLSELRLYSKDISDPKVTSISHIFGLDGDAYLTCGSQH